jgi:hypothetical protein
VLTDERARPSPSVSAQHRGYGERGCTGDVCRNAVTGRTNSPGKEALSQNRIFGYRNLIFSASSAQNNELEGGCHNSAFLTPFLLYIGAEKNPLSCED